jgi:tetratricopeptide (TPR) repeat protein
LIAPKNIEFEHWREKFRQQRISNACYWLEEIERATNSNALIVASYDNILRAIEMTIEDEDSFEVGYDLLEEVYPIAFELADWERWLIYLQVALKMSQKLGWKANQAYLHDWTATLLLVLNNEDEAEPHLKEALHLYLETGEMSRYSRILPKLARVHAMRGEFYSGFNLCHEALQLGENRQDKLSIADACFGFSSLHYLSRDWAQSHSYGQEALSIYKELNQQTWVNRVWYLIIACKVYLGFLQEAEKEAQELLDHLTGPANSFDSIFNVVQLRTAMGTIAFKQEDYRSAEIHWQEALQLNTLISFEVAAAPLRNNLGKAYTQMGEWEEARFMFSKALSFYEQTDNCYEWGNCMDNLADL